MSKKSSFCLACSENLQKDYIFKGSSNISSSQSSLKHTCQLKNSQFGQKQIPFSAQMLEVEHKNIANIVIKQLNQQNFNNNEFKPVQKNKERESVQEFYDYSLALYNSLNINGRQTRTSIQWRNYYINFIKVFNQKLFYMMSDHNYIPYLNKIKESLVSKRSYFNKVMKNTGANQQLPDARIANWIKLYTLPPLQKLVSYVGGSIKPVSELLYSTRGKIYYPGGRFEYV